MGARAARRGLGAAYLYKPDENGNWDLIKTFVPLPDVTQNPVVADGNFGWSVALDESGTAVIGAPFDRGVGALFVWRQVQPNIWTPLPRIGPPESAAIGDLFGFSVAIENSLAVAGARNTEVAGRQQAGAAYIYEISSDDATLVQTLTAPDPALIAHFGASVALKDDRLVVGSPSPNVVGSVYLHYRNDAGPWEVSEKVLGSSPSGSTRIRYGAATAVRRTALMVGAPANDLDGVAGLADAYVLVEVQVCSSSIEGPAPIIFPDAQGISINSITLSIPEKRYVRSNKLYIFLQMFYVLSSRSQTHFFT